MVVVAAAFNNYLFFSSSHVYCCHSKQCTKACYIVNAAYIPAWLISPVLTVVSAPVESSGFSAGFSLSDGFPSTY